MTQTTKATFADLPGMQRLFAIQAIKEKISFHKRFARLYLRSFNRLMDACNVEMAATAETKCHNHINQERELYRELQLINGR